MKEVNKHSGSHKGQSESPNCLELKRSYPNYKTDESLFSGVTTWCLLENNEILSSNEYWDLHRETNWNHSPAIRSSANKLGLVELARKKKHEQHEK